MTTTDLVDRLAAHRTLAAAPREELEWLVSHGSLKNLETGEVLAAKGGIVLGLYALLSGRIAIFIDRGAGSHKMMEWRAGDVTGLLPYSRLVESAGRFGRAGADRTILVVHRDHIPTMIRECHEITSILVHTMLDRARAFTSSDLHDEKMVSLGRLVGGTGARAEQPGVGDRTQRRAARGPAGGCRAGGARRSARPG